MQDKCLGIPFIYTKNEIYSNNEQNKKILNLKDNNKVRNFN